MRPILRVATINIWNRMGPWDERLTSLRAELTRLDPDVVGLQEVLVIPEHGFDQGSLLAEGTRYHVGFGRHPQADPSRIGNGVLSKYPITESAVLPLPGTDELRLAYFAALDTPYGRVPFFCTHLNWRLDHGHVRQAQVLALVEFIETHAPHDGVPPILVGDFNAEPDSDEMRYLRGLTTLGSGRATYFADCFAVAGDGTPGCTYSRQNDFAAMLREPNRRIDYVYVRGPDERFRGEPLSAKVAFDQRTNGVLPSDHFGLIAEIGM